MLLLDLFAPPAPTGPMRSAMVARNLCDRLICARSGHLAPQIVCRSRRRNQKYRLPGVMGMGPRSRSLHRNRAIAKPSTKSSTHDVHGAANTVDRVCIAEREIAARFARAIESAQRAHPESRWSALPLLGDRVDLGAATRDAAVHNSSSPAGTDRLASRARTSSKETLGSAVGEVEDVAGNQLDGLDHAHGVDCRPPIARWSKISLCRRQV